VKDDTIQSYIIPIDTRGLWGKIFGYLALKSDGSTVQGFTVYSHQETPGLGGEIESKWFRDNFVGKKIVDQANEFVSIRVAKGKAPEKDSANYVDGISGATLTGRFLTSGLKQILLDYEPVSLRFRSGNIGKKNQIDGNQDNNEK
jgi:Na+-transporting NADH:ubiquinone oxidoreductase subunit C